MTELNPKMKFVVVLFAAAFIIIAAASVYVCLEKRNQNDVWLGGIAVDSISPEYETLIAKSDLIVVATVKDKKGIWDTKDGKKPLTINIFNMKNEKRPFVLTLPHAGIKTEYTFEADEVLKGEAATFKGRTYGGRADGYIIDASGVPSFEPGEKVLLFLNENQDENGNLISWYHISIPTGFSEKTKTTQILSDAFVIEIIDGVYTNGFGEEIVLEQLRADIANAENKTNGF